MSPPTMSFMLKSRYNKRFMMGRKKRALYLQAGLVKILALFLFISLPSLACVDIEAEEELNTFIIKEKVEYSDLYHVSIYYPSEYLGAKAFRAKISFGDDFDNPSFTSSTIVSDTTKTKIDLKGYNYSEFESNQQVFDKAFLTVYYMPKKVEGDLIAFCRGPIAIYKLSDLAIKKV